MWDQRGHERRTRRRIAPRRGSGEEGRRGQCVPCVRGVWEARGVWEVWGVWG